MLLAAAILLAGGAAWLWRPQQGSHQPVPPPMTHGRSTYDQPILTPPVAALLSKDPIPLAQRRAILDTVGNKLPAPDRMALLNSISNTPPNGLTQDDWFSLANDILQTLRNQQPYMPEYTERLIALWHDKSLDPTLRDYALQQLREWVADGDTRSAHEERPEKIGLIQQTFIQACTPGHPDCDPQSTTTGTALLALDEWAYSSSPNLQSRISNLLLAHSGDPASHRGLRATALQICARRKIADALPIARAVIADTSAPAILQLSAIALIDSTGTPDDRALLAGLQTRASRDPLLQAALQKALGKSSAPAR